MNQVSYPSMACLVAGILLLSLTSIAAEVSWPEWRGLGGSGVVENSKLPTEWSETKNVIWKTPTTGRGWSSPVIADNEIWITTAIETEANKEDAARRLKSNTGDQPLILLDKVEFRALCLDFKTGKLKADIGLFEQKEPQWVHRLNSYASPTPVIESGRLYAHFGASGTLCVDTRSRKLVWLNQELQIQHENGPGSSPILWNDLLIFHMDGSDHQFVVALDKRSGRVVWKTPRSGTMSSNPQLKKSYATPLLLKLEGRAQLISPGANWLYSYDPSNGKELWKLEYGNLGFSLSARAVAGHGMLYMSTGFMRPEMLAIRLSGGSSPEIAWRYSKGVPTMASPVLVGNELYFVSDSGGMLTCLDAITGKEYYRERLGGDHNASLLAANGVIHIPAREGVTSMVKVGKEFNLLGKNQLDGKLMASTAVAGNSFIMRTDTAVYRIETRHD